MFLNEVLELEKTSQSIKKIDLFLAGCNKKSIDYFKAFVYRNIVLHAIGKTNDALKALYGMVVDFPKMDDEKIIVICDGIINITLEINRLDQAKKYINLKKKHLKVSESSKGIIDDINYYLVSKSYMEAIKELNKFINDEISQDEALWAYETLAKIHYDLHDFESFKETSLKLERIYKDYFITDKLIDLNYMLLEISYNEGNHIKTIFDGNRLLTEYNLDDSKIIRIATILLNCYLKSNDYRKASIIESNYEEKLDNVSDELALDFAKAGLELYTKTNSLVSINHYQGLVDKYSKEKKKKKEKVKKYDNVVIPETIESPEEEKIEEKEKVYNTVTVSNYAVSDNFVKLSKLYDMLNNLDINTPFREVYRKSLIELSKIIKFDEAYLLYYDKTYLGLHYKKERAYDKKINFEILDDTINFLAITKEQEVFLDENSYHGLKDIVSGNSYEQNPYGIAIPLYKEDVYYASIAFFGSTPFLMEELAYETLLIISKMINTNLINSIKQTELKNNNKKMFYVFENMSSGIKELMDENIHLSNQAKEMFGTLEDLSNNDYLYHIHNDDLIKYKECVAEVYQYLSNNKQIEYRFKKNGIYINIRETFFSSYENGRILIYSLLEDITKDIIDKNNLINLAYTNPITKLNSELKLLIDLKEYANNAKMSLAIIDVYDFKLYEELYGLNFSNQLIYAIGVELSKALEKYFHSHLYHLEFDRYAILIEGMNDKRTIDSILMKILNTVSLSLNILNKRVKLKFNCGVFRVSKSSNIDDVNKILLYAYNALSDAKSIKNNETNISHYDSNLAKVRFNENQLVTHISEAIDHGKIGITYKQVVDNKNNEVFAYYANISLDNYDVDLDFMERVIKRRDLEEMIDKYVISNASKELKMLYDTVKANLHVMIKLDEKTIDKELVSFIETQNNFYKTTKKSIIFIVDSADNLVIKSLRNLGYKVASSSLMDVYQQNIDYFIYDVCKGYNILPKIIETAKEFDVELILSGIDTKEDVERVKEHDINYFYGQFYKKSIRMKKVIEKVS